MSTPLVQTLTDSRHMPPLARRASDEQVSSAHTQPPSNPTRKTIITLSYHSVNVNNHTQCNINNRKISGSKTEIDVLYSDEQQSARPMCIPLEVAGVPMGYALVDQGATKTVMRQSALAKLAGKYEMRRIRNMYVVGSTGEEIPIIGCFAANIASGGQQIGRTLIYVVRNTTQNDIICDFVLGRSSLANSNYPCIDMRNDGKIYHPNNNEKIVCYPCVFRQDNAGQHHLHISQHNTHNVTRSISASSPESDSEDEREKEKESMHTCIDKSQALHAIVDSRHDVAAADRACLYS